MKAFKTFGFLPIILALSGCGIYIQDARLEGPAAKAKESLLAADPLVPFDDQLVKLAAFAKEEDSGVAEVLASRRNAHFARLIADPSGTALLAAIDRRLVALAPKLINAPAAVQTLGPIAGRRAVAADRIRVAERTLADLRLQWTEAKFDPAPNDCMTMLKAVPADRQDEMALSADLRTALSGQLAANCRNAAQHRGDVAQDTKTLTEVGGELAFVTASLGTLEAATVPETSDYAEALTVEIDAAEQAAKSGVSAQLVQFRDRIDAILTTADQASRLAGWDKVDKGLDKILNGLVCGSSDDAIDKDRRTAACATLGKTDTAAKTKSAWLFIEAVGQLIDANAPAARAAQWVVAAKAIVASEKADAALQNAAAKQAADAERRRLEALIREANALVLAKATGTSRASPSCIGRSRACAFAAYAQSWNEGRIPAGILRYRLVQIEREYAVRRSRAVAQRQQALALAGTDTIDEYAKSGVKPKSVYQTVFDLTLLGVTAEND